MIIRPQPEVAEVIRSCYDEFLERYGKGLTPEQRRTLDDLARCRTAALGGHVLECPQCGHRQISYNSCGNRHCPKCQATASARWLEAQAADLLPVPYTKSGKFVALLFHGLCRLGKIDWASESHQELDRCLSRTITASKNFND